MAHHTVVRNGTAIDTAPTPHVVRDEPTDLVITDGLIASAGEPVDVDDLRRRQPGTVEEIDATEHIVLPGFGIPIATPGRPGSVPRSRTARCRPTWLTYWARSHRATPRTTSGMAT